MFRNVTIHTLKKMFSLAFDRLNAGHPWQPFFIVGAPGLGKTHLYRYVLRAMYAEHLGVSIDEVGVVEVLAAEKDPTATAGLDIPVKRDDGTWVTRKVQSPVITQIEETGCKYGLLTLEELGSAPQDMQKVLSPLLDPDTRTIGDDKIPDGWLVNANGNRAQDKSGAVATLAHLSDRVRFLNLVFCLTSWLKWAKDNCVNVFIREFVAAFADQSLFATCVPSSREPVQSCTPRSIVNASRDLDAYMANPDFSGWMDEWFKDMLSSNIGDAATDMMSGYMAQRDQVPDFSQIIADPKGCLLSDETVWQRISGDIAISGIEDDHTADRALQYIVRMRPELQVPLGTKLIKICNQQGLELYESNTAQVFQQKYKDLLPLAFNF